MTSDSPDNDPIAEIRTILLGSALSDLQAILNDLSQRVEAQGQGLGELGGRAEDQARLSAEVSSRLADLAHATGEREQQVREALDSLGELGRELGAHQQALEARLAGLERNVLARDEFQQIIRDVSNRLGGGA